MMGWTGLLLLNPDPVSAQKYDLLIKAGHLIDPANSIDAQTDIAITQGKIIKVAKTIADTLANKTINASGFYIAPGLIDIHTHVFVGNQPDLFANGVNSVSPDDFSFRSGVTTVVDAGTSGWKSFPLLKKQVIDQAKTRVLVFLNIAAQGMTGAETEQNLQEMNVDSTVRLIRQYPDIIVGIKIGHYNGEDWAPFERAAAAARRTAKPLFVECHLPQYSLQDQLTKMQPGDIITHTFEHISERMPIVDENGEIRMFVSQARNRGILFDLGHGGAGFWFDQAKPAAAKDFFPDTFGTDLHRFSMNSAMKDMMNVMSKFMALGLSLDEVIKRGSWNAAKAIRHQELGNVSEGSVADLVIFKVREGKFGFTDSSGSTIEGTRKLEAELTVKQGKVVWDLNGLSTSKPRH